MPQGQKNPKPKTEAILYVTRSIKTLKVVHIKKKIVKKLKKSINLIVSGLCLEWRAFALLPELQLLDRSLWWVCHASALCLVPLS